LHFKHLTLREWIVEHAFIGDALRLLWQRDIVDVEVLRSEFDAHGYDLVMARGPVVRHIQFKTGMKKPLKVSVAAALATKPSGCVIFIVVTPALEMGPFYWFGGNPGETLPAIGELRNPKRTTRNKAAERPLRKHHREIPGKEFQILQRLEQVLQTLFDPLNTLN